MSNPTCKICGYDFGIFPRPEKVADFNSWNIQMARWVKDIATHVKEKHQEVADDDLQVFETAANKVLSKLN